MSREASRRSLTSSSTGSVALSTAHPAHVSRRSSSRGGLSRRRSNLNTRAHLGPASSLATSNDPVAALYQPLSNASQLYSPAPPPANTVEMQTKRVDDFYAPRDNVAASSIAVNYYTDVPSSPAARPTEPTRAFHRPTGPDTSLSLCCACHTFLHASRNSMRTPPQPVPGFGSPSRLNGPTQN